ncbi:DinB family protein [Peterkaempfera bronchialis]|uniref:DinB family protein n=1 Tax=Peterkaempfera bronchialis TaxID=2126346 RepID=UPI003C2B9C74
MITPDTKDWTWVLRRPCSECGFDPVAVPREAVADLLRANAAAWAALLTAEPASQLRQRPRPDVWSPLEYACHVRDVCRIYTTRLGLMLTQDSPLFANWDQDETAVTDRYGEQDPARVAPELTAAADTLAAAFDRVSGDQWHRPGDRSDGAHFTVESFARYFVHDPLHHLWDVTGDRVAA